MQLCIDSSLDLTDNQYQQDDKAQRLVRNKLNLFLDPETRVAHVKAMVTLLLIATPLDIDNG